MNAKKIILLLVLGAHFGVFSQTFDQQSNLEEDSLSKGLIQFSGVVVTGDSLAPVPYVNVYDKKSHRGTTSDFYGYFSFVAKKLDTVVFSSVGFKRSFFVIPDTLTTNRYSMIHMMIEDTIELDPQNIYPWPSKEDFADAFLNLDVNDDRIRQAKKKLTPEELASIGRDMPTDGSLNYKWQMQQYQSRLYYNGQAPPLNILNPLAWAEFIKAWRDGELKRE